MAEYHNLYQRATYYDIGMGREVGKEVDFICGVYQQCNGSTPTSLLDLACGPGYHARDFARRGKRAVGLDLRKEMISFAQNLAAEDGVEVEWLAADMRYVHLEKPVDIAINMFDGIDCLQSNGDLIAHFRAIASSLTPGGLYLIDNTHPQFVSYHYYAPYCFRGERNGINVEIRWAVNQPTMNPLTHVLHTQIELHVNDNGDYMVFPDEADERILTAQEIILLAELSGVFEPIAWYGDYNLNQPLDTSPASPRMIAVLQKID